MIKNIIFDLDECLVNTMHAGFAALCKAFGEFNLTYDDGDGMGDVKAGKEAGIKTIAVAWGHEPNKTSLKNAAEYYAENVDELEKILTS